MFRWLAVCAALVVCQFAVVAQVENGDFEELDESRFPVKWGWFASQKEDALVRITTDAAEGRFALYMESRSTATVGVNRLYRAGKPGEVIPDIGALLPFKKGALVFRYKVIKATSDNVRVYAIPMKSDNLEFVNSREVYIIQQNFLATTNGTLEFWLLIFQVSPKSVQCKSA